MEVPQNYAQRFQDRNDVESYERVEYAANSYSTRMWQLQQPILKQILSACRNGRKTPTQLLDFACGTGRVLSFIESLVDQSEGVDISPEMVAVARQRCGKSN